MKPTGVMAELTGKLGSLVAADSSELMGLRYQAKKLLDKHPDEFFRVEFADGEWRLRFAHDIEGQNKIAASALRRYAEARLAVVEKAVDRLAAGRISVSLAASLLDSIPDAIAAQIRKGRIEGKAEEGRLTTTVAALAAFVERFGTQTNSYDLPQV